MHSCSYVFEVCLGYLKPSLSSTSKSEGCLEESTEHLQLKTVMKVPQAAFVIPDPELESSFVPFTSAGVVIQSAQDSQKNLA